MRLHAERGRTVILFLASVVLLSGACAKTWVLDPDSRGGPGGAGARGGGAGTPSGGAAGGGGVGAAGGGGQDVGGSRSEGGSTGSGGFFGMGGRGSFCANAGHVAYDIPTTDMVFLVGRDVSMSSKFGDETRMSATQAGLQTVIAPNETAVNFGYQDFPSLNGACSGGTSCCASQDFPVYPGALRSGAIDHALHQCGQGPPGNACVAQADSRPVAQALAAASSLFNSPPDILNDRDVVLMVDGPPGCVGEDPSNACLSALMAVSMLSSASIKTYVIGVGDAAQDEPCLQQIALMGGTSTPLFNTSDPTSLSKALGQIVTSATESSCTIRLHEKVDPSLISVLLQGHEIPYDPSRRDGWSYVAGSSAQIQVYGSSCRDLQGALSAHPGTVLMILSGCPPCGEAFACPH